MNAIDLLLARNSHARLIAPAPDDAQLDVIIRAAMRAPDHARLTPWRFISIEGAAREKLGEVFVAAQLTRDANTASDKLDKLRGNPLRAPLLLVVVARLANDAKVPVIEQQLSAGCAAQAALLAAEALGFGGIWRTGDMAYDRSVANALGLSESEQVVGFLYLGSMEGAKKPLPKLNSADFLTAWQ